MTQEVPRVTVDEAALGPDLARHTFAAMVRDIFHAERLDADPGQAVAVAAWYLGTTMVGTFAGPAMRFVRDAARVAGSGLDQVLVQLYTRGGFEGTAAGIPITVAAGDICVFDLAETIETRATAFANISLLVPREALRDGIEDVAVLHGLVVGGTTPMGAMLGDHLRSLVGNIGALRGRDAAFAAAATLSMVTAALAASSRGRKRSAPVGAHMSPLRRACDFIDAHIDDPALDVDRIALALGSSRATLFRVFADEGGVAHYLRRRRLNGAARDLADPVRVRRVGEIAQRWGFSSDTVFSRAFRQAFGVSPRAARRHNHPPLASETRHIGDDAAERRFAGWLHSLHGAAETPGR